MKENEAAILARIKKLLRLAERAGTTEEAENAMARVREILHKYNLSIQDVESVRDEECVEEEIVIKSKYIPRHIKVLVTAMQKLFHCRVIFCSVRFKNELHLTFVGVGADALVAAQTFQFLLAFAKRKAKERKLGASEKSDYLFGFAHGIYGRAMAIQREMADCPQESALVPVKESAIDAYLAREHGDMKDLRQPRQCSSSRALFAGLQDGKKASLDRQVESGSRLRMEQ